MLENLSLGEDAGLAALFASSFLAATLLPGGSEAVLFGVLKLHPQLYWPALGLATLGNTLGGMSTYLLGRFIPERAPSDNHPRMLRALAWSRAHGAPALLLAWAPLIGDALCLAAGWLRLNAGWSVFWMGLGKFLRYLLVAQVSA
ncbi:MAG TPA: YqaA family protein [Burkholderiales bacterium]|nr:YqaA family protein [Burkholderiales bacterium]